MTFTLLLFALSTIFWYWVVFRGGADWLEGTMLSGFLVFERAPEWPAQAIKVFGVLAWIASLGWFVLRLTYPSLRP